MNLNASHIIYEDIILHQDLREGGLGMRSQFPVVVEKSVLEHSALACSDLLVDVQN